MRARTIYARVIKEMYLFLGCYQTFLNNNDLITYKIIVALNCRQLSDFKRWGQNWKKNFKEFCKILHKIDCCKFDFN
jgi:hypothetical protein